MAAARLVGVGDLLRRGQQAHERVWFELVGADLTSVQYGVLLTVGRRPESSQQQISTEMSIDKSTVGNVLHRLADRGLVELGRDAVDERRHVVLLTEQGRSALLEASPAAMQVSDRFLRALSFMDGETLVRLLREVAYNGSPPDPADTPPRFPDWPMRLPVLRFDMTFGHLVRRAQRVYGATWREVVGSASTPVQFDALMVLAESGTVEQRSWAESASLDPATATSLLTRLKSRGLVERLPHETDRRRRQLSLTQMGREALDTMSGQARTVEQTILRPLTGSEQAVLVELLRKVCRL